MIINEVPFSSILAIPLKNGLTRPSAVRGHGTKFVNMGELFANPRIYDIPMDRVEVAAKEMSFLLERGDLLFARQSLVLSGAGKCSIFLGYKEQYVFESHLIRARINNEKANSLYWYYYFNSEIG